MFQLRFSARQPGDTAPGNFYWGIVEHDSGNVIEAGGDEDLEGAVRTGVEAFKSMITKISKTTEAKGLLRYEEACPCGATLVVEARLSKKSPHSWESIRELTCGCGRSFDVNISFLGPRIYLIYRKTVA